MLRRRHLGNMTARSTYIALLFATTTTASSGAVDDKTPPKMGDPAPRLSLTKIYDRPSDVPRAKDLEWRHLAGRIVVLDFSTSWCGPCIRMIPHMNELATAFEDDPVVFLTISNESEKTVTAFRKQHHFDTLFARDADGSTFEDYWVNGIPYVVIVDKSGHIAAQTHPSYVTEAAIRDLLAGKTIDLPKTNTKPVARSWNVQRRAADTKAGEARITKVEKLTGRYQWGKGTGRLEFFGLPLRSLISSVYDFPDDQMDYRLPLEPSVYYDAVAVPKDMTLESARRLVQAKLEREFKFSTAIEKRLIPVKLLRPYQDEVPPKAANPDLRGGSARAGLIDHQSITMAGLATVFQVAVRSPVIDDTGLTGIYDIRLEWDITGGRTAFAKALRELGLELVDAERPVDHLLVMPDK